MEKQRGRERKYFLTTASLIGGKLNEEKGLRLKITLGLAFKCPQNYKLIKNIRVIEEKKRKHCNAHSYHNKTLRLHIFYAMYG